MSRTFLPKRPSKSRFNSFARRIVISRLKELKEGQIKIIENNKTILFGNLTDDFPEAVNLNVINQDFYSCIA